MIEDCLFTGNEADGDGGALYCSQGAEIVVSRCTVTSNRAQNAGGGICASQGGAAWIESCTLTANRAPFGGGMAVWNSRYDIDNTIVAFNEEGSAIAFHEENQVTLRCSDLYGNAAGDWTVEIEDQLGVEGNICLDPLFCLDAHPEAPLSLDSESPCAAEQNPACGLIGAWPVACGDVSTIERSLSDRTRGRIQLWAHPNPFTGATAITYAAAGEPVSVRVYDLAGRRVRTLVTSSAASARQVAKWDGTDERGEPLPGGVYLLRPTHREAGVAQRVLLVR